VLEMVQLFFSVEPLKK